ncbi:MAG: phosphoribosylglycinamide formyltransferase [Desulfobacterales bacterium]
MKQKIRIGALISGGGTNLQAVIDACGTGAVDGALVVVGSDMPDAYGLQRAASHGIPTIVVDYRPIIQAYRRDRSRFRTPEGFDLEALRRKTHLFASETPADAVDAFLITRAAAEARILDAMKAYPFDLLILAGFMRNLTPYFIDRINAEPERPRIMNIHPALLPAFPGVDGYGDTFRYGCKVGGCTVHFVDYGEDTGPIIGQKAFAIEPEDTLDHVRKKGLELEWQLYPECIQLFAENRLRVVERIHSAPKGLHYHRKVVEVLPPSDKRP